MDGHFTGRVAKEVKAGLEELREVEESVSGALRVLTHGLAWHTQEGGGRGRAEREESAPSTS